MALGQAVFQQVVIQDLPASATEDFLKSLVQDIAPPREIVIKHRPDLRGGGQRSFAFLRFDTQADCELVISELNYTKLDGRPIRVMLVDPAWKQIQRTGQGNLFVSGLDDSIEDAQLHDAFATFGEIVSCKIVRNAKGVSRGFGYVQFRHPENAQTAKEDLKGATINNHPIHIEDFQPRRRGPAEETYTNVFVRNLPPSFRTDDDVRALFGPFGTVQSPKLAAQGGFGFCNMATHESAVAAVKGLSGREVEGKVLYACRAKTKEERAAELRRESESWRAALYLRTKDRNLFIRNFGEEMNDGELRDLFGRYGEIESLKIQRDDHGRSRGWGYVCYKDDAAATRALRESTLLKIGDRQVHVARFVRQQQRARQNLLRGSSPPRAGPAPLTNPASFPGLAPTGTFGSQAGFGGAYPGSPIIPPAHVSSKERLRQDITDHYGPTASALARLKALSEEQAKALSNEPRLYEEWLQLDAPPNMRS